MDASPSPDIQEKDDHDKRVSEEVSSLSTKLIEAIDRQSSLETSNQALKRQNSSLNQQLQELKDFKGLYDKLSKEHAELKAELEKSLKLKDNAEQEVSRLRVEIEELSESLFNEANKMVKDAMIDADNYKVMNSKLSETLAEKDTTIESLSNELKILKKLLYDLESSDNQERKKSVVSTPDISVDSLVSEKAIEPSETSQRDPTTLQTQSTMFSSAKLSVYDKQLIYTPIYNSLRFDLENFQDFVKFVKFVYNRNSKSTIVTPVDFSILKETAFFKKIYREEIEPAMSIDNAPGISYFNRKNFVGALVEGRVIIEPISGVNESFKLNHKKTEPEDSAKEKMFSYPKNSPPVATLSPCSICGEARNDILEHSRLYTLKLYSKKTTHITQHKYDPPASPAPVKTALPNESPSSPRAVLEITHQYSLCNYCLIKIRHICELFAFIRNVNNAPKTKVWNFETETQSKVDLDLECIKAWFQITKIRAKIFWARIGIWDINEYSHGDSSLNTPPLKKDVDLGFRGSVIGTGIVAGNRQSFMESINADGAAIASLGRRPDIISTAKSSPIARSPLVNQVQGYFEDEDSAAATDDIIESHFESESESINAGDLTLIKETVDTEQELDENAEYESGGILDDYGDSDEEQDASAIESPVHSTKHGILDPGKKQLGQDEIVPAIENGDDVADEVDEEKKVETEESGTEEVKQDFKVELESSDAVSHNDAPPKVEVESDEEDSSEFNDASEHMTES